MSVEALLRDLQNAIPPMTDPLGRHWNQPPSTRIVIDDTHALMSQEDFDALHEYSTTMPSGVYPGKMWRAQRGGCWFLRWYGLCDDPTRCSNNQRELLLP